MNAVAAMRAAAVVMFLAVALGAMGAHALKDRLVEAGTTDAWKTAALYHLVHGLAMVVLAVGSRGAEAGQLRNAGSWWLFLAGVLLFSGSLYALALGGPRWLGPVTPLGGVAFLAGWVWLAVRPGAGR